jgi:Carboxypeptidase regulatory-like domain/TonB dependent receptor-like, beta-barrel/TonB-dependent Receptor Plug Domain
MHRLAAVAAAAVGVWLLVVGSAYAQQGTGELRGRVVDAQNAVLPGVTVTAKNEGSGQFREVVSGPDGSFFMSALIPGSYELSAQLAGFRTFQRGGVRVEVGKTQSIDVAMQVGGVEEKVTVTAESPIVDTTTKQLGGSVQSQELQDVPSVNRNFTSYLSLLPGVTATISTDSFGADSIRVNGQATQNANYMLDGAGNNDNFNNGNGGAQARIPVEAVQEFQLLTSQFDAEFGQSSGGIVNAVSRQGTNVVHGTGFFFESNQKMTSLDYFAKQQGLSKPEARQIQYGGWLGGPIVKDKLHYFANLERIDQNRARTININARPEFNFTTFTHDNVWNWMARLDHQISANNTWAVRWLRESSPQSNQFVATNLTRDHAEAEDDHDWTVVGTLSSVIRNTKVNTVKVSYTHEDVFFGNPGYFDDLNKWIATPQLRFQTFDGGASTRANRRMDPAYQVDETFAWFMPGKKGDHDLKFGASYYYLPLHVFDATNINGTFTFSASDRDFNPADPRTYPDRFQIRVPGNSDYFVKGSEAGVFAQDKWKVNNRVTLSLGLRWDLEMVDIDESSNFLFKGSSESPRDKNNFSPRLGLTWTLDDKATAVVRGGYGKYYQKTAYSNFTNLVAGGVTSNSFTVNFPTNNVDAGPSAGRLPTDPFLVNGPVVNRALLNAMFPPGSTTKNTGTVDLDSPDRHLSYAHEGSIGFEKQLAGSMAVSADYVHLSHRDLLMRQEINPGIRASTARTATVTRIYPVSVFNASVRELVNLGYADYNGLQMSVTKRASRGYSFRASYTYSKGTGIVGAPGAISDITTYTVDPVTQAVDLHLAERESLTDQDRPHLFSLSGAWQIPHTGGVNVSGVLQANSGTPLTLTDDTTDPNRNGQFEEPLPAGSYSGVSAAFPQNAITVDNKSGFNGARAPGYFLINTRVAYRFKLPGTRTLQAHFDIFNLTNHANFNPPSTNRRDAATFLVVRSILNGGPTRTAQFNLTYRF